MIKECKTCGYPFIANNFRDIYGSPLCKKIDKKIYHKHKYLDYKQKEKIINGMYISSKPRKSKICIYCGYPTHSDLFNLCKRRKHRMWGWLYEQTYHFKVKRAEWSYSKQGRQCIRKNARKFKRSELGKLSERKYRRTDKRKKVLVKYNQSFKGIIANRMKVMRYYEKKMLIEGRARIPIEIGHFIFKLFDYRCVNCDSQDKLVIDHFYPLRNGNSIIKDGKLNGCLLCNSCNLKKGYINPEEFFDENKFNEIKNMIDIVTLDDIKVKMND